MRKQYSIKEAFYTLQGEGYHAGRPAVFCRFTGCNLWNGLESGREKAICKFCDTDFIGTDGENGGRYSAEELATKILQQWPEFQYNRFVVFTGGEPLLQLDKELIEAVKAKGFEVAVETNGTIAPPEGIDWLCVSPKAGSKLVVTAGEELKVVYPQDFIYEEELEELNFKHFYIQPMDNAKWDHTASAVSFCKDRPQWKLSLQLHKILNIP